MVCPAATGWRSGSDELLGAGTVGTPAWRGDRQFFMRRTAEQEHAVLLTVDPDGTERVLVDPVAIDASGTTTLDAWQPSKEGHLLAYQLSAGGTEESVLHVIDVATGELGRGPDRPGPLLAGRVAARRRGVLLRTPGARRSWCPRTRRSTTGGSGCTGSAPTPRPTSRCCGAGLDMTNYYGVTVSMDGRWLVVGASAGTAPRNDLWLADLSDGRLDVADAAGRAGGRGRAARRCTSAGTDGCTSSRTGTRPAAGWR